ncbi:MAG: hypothetical protein WBB01_08050 [Phormidesmis sp.]
MQLFVLESPVVVLDDPVRVAVPTALVVVQTVTTAVVMAVKVVVVVKGPMAAVLLVAKAAAVLGAVKGLAAVLLGLIDLAIAPQSAFYLGLAEKV